MLYPKLTINCRGKLLSLETPIIMGILNVTPDSFYDGGRFIESNAMLQQVEQMLEEGAAIIDIGGMSSRPGAEVIDVEEEKRRVLPVVEVIVKRFPEAILSVDTVRSEIALKSVARGAHIINDISAGSIDPEMYATVAKLGIPYVLMHMQGRPENMQENPSYEDIIQEVLDFFIGEVGKLRELGVKDIIIDPGFGFGKTLENNYHLLANMHIFGILECPVLTGISRKSMIYKLLDTRAAESLNATSALHMIALQQGSKILRVHDVKAAQEVVKLWQMVSS